ncbi:hypothetical protein [Aeromicrobium sp. Root236]|uniref:hypothetical protein n=1 Tax=Aeromicrobium sp. Root236 TaxID=1736498 RepID=UPI000B0EF922|nr:hypothetical protein [Aeromicrobium sp. Root236]
MSTYRSHDGATGLTADRALRALRAAMPKRFGSAALATNEGCHARLSFVQELPM